MKLVEAVSFSRWWAVCHRRSGQPSQQRTCV